MKKILKIICISFILVIFSTCSFFINEEMTSNETIRSCSFETFSHDLINLLNKYDSDIIFETNQHLDDVNSRDVSFMSIENQASIRDDLFNANTYPNRLIVKSLNRIHTFGAIDYVMGYRGLNILQYKDEKTMLEAYEKYKSLSCVEYVIFDEYVTLENVDEDRILNNIIETAGYSNSFTYASWGADAMGIKEYSKYLLPDGTTVSDYDDVYVAVLDTGIDTDHPWFANRIAFEYGKNCIDNSSSVEDTDGHGTHVSGIICDLTLSNTKIIPIKVFSSSGFGNLAMVITGIEHVNSLKENGVNICAMNLSLTSQYNDKYYNDYISLFSQSIANGINIVVAAGNNSKDASGFIPAAVDSIITVSALSQYNEHIGFDHNYSNHGEVIDFSAPGTAIVSAAIDGGTTTLDGTSMASPHVAAAVALLYTNDNNLSPSEIYDILKNNAVDIGVKGKDNYYGYGLVNLEFAHCGSLDGVTFSKTEGNYAESFNLELFTNSNEVSILYTLNGKDPLKTNEKFEYTTSLSITSATQIMARAVVFDGSELISVSRLNSAVYSINGQDVANAFTINGNGHILEYNGFLKNIYIPSQVNGVTVTGIGGLSFAYNDTITEIYLPSTIKKIEDSAFYLCTSLKNINLQNVTELEEKAFYGCVSLENVDISNVTKMGSSAFRECISLKSIENLNSSLETISNATFEGCKSLSGDMDLENVKDIQARAFHGCSQLTLKNYKSQTTAIGPYTFYLVDTISNFNLSSVVTIGNSAFNSVTFCNPVNVFNFSNIISIGDYAFWQTNLEGDLSLNCEKLGGAAFYNCTGLTSIELNNPILTKLENFVFGSCENVTSVKWPYIQEMGMGVFGSNKLTNLELPSIKTYGSGALYCPNLQDIYIGRNFVIGSEDFVDLYNVRVHGYTGSTAMEYVNNFISKYKFDAIFIPEDLSLNKFNYTDEKLEIDASGHNICYDWYESSKKEYLGKLVQTGNNNTLQFPSKGKYYYATITDWAGETVTSNILPNQNSHIISLTYDKIIESAFLSTNPTATTGNPSGTIYDYGTTVYYFVTLPVNSAQYTYTYPEAELITGTTYRVGSILVSENTTIQLNGAIRTTNTYMVTFYSEDGNTKLGKSIVEYGKTAVYTGESLTKAATAQYTYTFANWVTTQGGSTVDNLQNVVANRNVYASFTSTVNNYTVTIKVNTTGYGTVSSTSIANVPYGTELSTRGNQLTIDSTIVTATPTTNTAQYTYAFSSWTNGSATITGAITVTANFTRTINKYTITWKNDDGTTLKTDLVEYGQTPSYTGETPTKTATAQYTYTFSEWTPTISSVTKDATYTASFSSTTNTYTLIIKVNTAGYGSVDKTSVALVPYGTELSTSGNQLTADSTIVTATPTTNTAQYTYAFSSWTNGTTTVTGNTTVTANFTRTINKYTIKFVDWDNTELQSEELEYGTLPVFRGETPTRLTEGGVNYTFIGWTPEIVPVTGEATYTTRFTEPQNAYTITASTNNYGTITPSGNIKVAYGDDKTFTFEAYTGYKIDKVYVDGVNVGNVETYTFNDITDNHTINVTFTKTSYTITAITSANGIITPEGISNVLYGEGLNYTFMPNTGYKVKDVKIDNVSIGAVSHYTFVNVDRSHTISVEYEIQKFNISLSVDGQGSLYTNSTLENITYGEDRTFTISADEGWELFKVYINGNSVNVSNNKLTINDINKDIIIQAIFKEKEVVAPVTGLDTTTIAIIIGTAIISSLLITLLIKLHKNSKRRKLKDLKQSLATENEYNNYQAKNNYTEYEKPYQIPTQTKAVKPTPPNPMLQKALNFVKDKQENFISFCNRYNIDYKNHYNNAVLRYYQAYLRSIKPTQPPKSGGEN